MVKPRQHEPPNNGTLGLKQSHSLTNMPFGSLLDVLNMNLDGLGGKSCRQGYGELFHLTNGVGGARIHDTIKSLIQFKPTTGDSEILAFAKQTIYKQSDSESVAIVAGLAANARWEWCQYNDYIHGVNGNDVSFLYDGTTYTTISITAPTANVTLTEVGGGGLTNTGAGQTYAYLVTFYDSANARESASFAATMTGIAVAANGPITLSNLPAATAGEGVTHYRVYRKRLAETTYTRISDDSATYAIAQVTISDNDDTNHTTELEVDTGTIDEGFTAHPQSDLIVEAFDRIFMVPSANPTMIVYSQAGGKSFAFPTGNFYPIGRKDGNKILRIEKHGESLVIHKRNGVWLLDEPPSASVTPYRITGQGTQDSQLSASDDNVLLRLTPDGFYLTSPTENSATDLRDFYIGKDVVEEEKLIDWSNTEDAHIVSYNGNNSRHMYFMQPSVANTNTKVTVLDTSLREWVKYELGSAMFSAADYEVSGEKLLMLGDDYGMVWTWDANDADGTDLTHTYLNGTVTASTATSLTDEDIVDDSGTVNSATNTTLVDSSQTWIVDQWVGKQVYIKSGTGVGSYGTVSENTATELTISVAWAVNPAAGAVYQIGGWDVEGLVGVTVDIITGTGFGQRRRITSNTADTVTVATWTTNPTTISTYSIGKIKSYAEEFWNNNQAPDFWKRMRWIVPSVRQDIPSDIKVSFRRDFVLGSSGEKLFTLAGSEGLWDSFYWDVGYWDASTHTIKRLRLRGKYHYYSIKYEALEAGQRFNWDGHTSVYQVLYDKNK